MKILLIGCGHIGLPLLKIWVDEKLGQEIVVIQPSMKNSSHFKSYHPITFIKNETFIPQNFVEDLVVIAVKPQHIQSVIPYLRKRSGTALVVSVLAGIRLEKLSALLPQHPKIIRLMPNIALQARQSVNLAFASEAVKNEAGEIFHHIFSPSGEIIFLEKEEHINKLTPLSGSGPAYFFLLAELLLQETMGVGLSQTQAKKLVDQLLRGSASLIQEDLSYEEMVQSVTSKKGVTEAALKVMRPGLASILKESITAALTREQELSHENSD